MDTRELATALRDLLAVADHDQSFVAGPLPVLTAHLTEAIASYLGLQVLLTEVGHPFRLTSFLRPGTSHPVGTSIEIPLTAIGLRDQSGKITFYAHQPGAFVDLAADLNYALGLDDRIIHVDDAPGDVDSTSGIDGLNEISTINRALGVMIARGTPPDEALATLQREAARNGVTVYVEASAIYGGLGDS